MVIPHLQSISWTKNYKAALPQLERECLCKFFIFLSGQLEVFYLNYKLSLSSLLGLCFKRVGSLIIVTLSNLFMFGYSIIKFDCLFCYINLSWLFSLYFRRSKGADCIDGFEGFWPRPIMSWILCLDDRKRPLFPVTATCLVHSSIIFTILLTK